MQHGPGAVGRGSCAACCLDASRRRVGELLLLTATLPWGSGQWKFCTHTTALPWGSGRRISCCVLLHYLGAAGNGLHAAHCLNAWGQGPWNPCKTPSHCLRAVGGRSPGTHRRTAYGQWATELLQYTATLPGGSELWKSCKYTAALPWGSGQWISCGMLLHCLGCLRAAGTGPRATHCLTAWAVGSGNPAVHCLTVCLTA